VATKKCKYCQTDIDQKAKICPNCKKDQRGFFAKHPIITGILVLFVIGIIASAGGSPDKTDTGSESKSTSTNKETTENNKPTVQENAVPVAKLNEDIQVGDVKWKVIKAWTASQLSDYSGAVKPAGKFLVVNVVVENLGKDMKTVSNLKVVDDKGREFTSYSKSFVFQNLGADSLYILSNINPNVPLTFADVYEIPADAQGLKLEVGDLSLLGNGEGLVDLGL